MSPEARPPPFKRPFIPFEEIDMEPKPTRAEAFVQRLLLAAALTAALLGGVVSLFGEAAEMPWLASTAENRQAMAACERVHGTALRQRCAERVVAQRTRASDPHATMQASADHRSRTP